MNKNNTQFPTRESLQLKGWTGTQSERIEKDIPWKRQQKESGGSYTYEIKQILHNNRNKTQDRLLYNGKAANPSSFNNVKYMCTQHWSIKVYTANINIWRMK